MCGVAGFIDTQATPEDGLGHLARMTSCLEHRGPDDVGLWQGPGIALGHRRLSIVDLSQLGHQPMRSCSGRYILVFNGEIYNHRALRKQLEAAGNRFKGHSDTEVLLALIEDVGLQQAVIQCVGMFALALWDSQERTLRLARDRFGEKPLYYGWHRGRFLFGSELKSLVSHPAFEKAVSEEALQMLLRFGYIPAPHCIFQNTSKLVQGSILTLRMPENGEKADDRTCRPTLATYWSAEDVALRGMEAPFEGTFAEATDALDALLAEAVVLQMEADVPLGAFLSGGIDSSLVVALMQHNSSRPARTFSIGFHDADFNEAVHAKAVASHLGTDHTELYVSSRDALQVIPDLPTIYDEPFADPSQIPTYLVAKLASREVRVSLSGDGGDELFCGYTKYDLGQRFADIPGRRMWGGLVGALPWRSIERIGRAFSPTVGAKLHASRFATLHSLLSADGYAGIAEQVSLMCREPQRLTQGTSNRSSARLSAPAGVLARSYKTFAMVLDRQSYLPDDILTKTDRASMAVSLENRAPLLDHRVGDFTARLPTAFLSDGKRTKKVLREVLYRYVPRSLVDRPKAGFSIPLASWLRGDLRDWATDLLSGSHDGDDTFLDLGEARAILRSHLSGERDAAMLLWPILMFQAWRRRWV